MKKEEQMKSKDGLMQILTNIGYNDEDLNEPVFRVVSNPRRTIIMIENKVDVKKEEKPVKEPDVGEKV